MSGLPDSAECEVHCVHTTLKGSSPGVVPFECQGVGSSLRGLRLQYLLMSEGSFQRRSHLHLAELLDGEVKTSFLSSPIES
jgi:hypothetical protein